MQPAGSGQLQGLDSTVVNGGTLSNLPNLPGMNAFPSESEDEQEATPAIR